MSVPFLDLKAAYEELKDPIDEAVSRVLNSGWYILGEEVERFERAFADYCGTKHCIGVGNGYDALVLSLRVLDIGPGDEVIVPANTYIATWLGVTAVGATCIPVEPEEAGCNINIDLIEDAITEKTKAILPVDLYGHPVDMQRLRTLADRYSLKVVEDCAQAHGASWKGAMAGSLADLGAYSFYPTKNLGALGDAGAIVTSDDDLADKLRLLRNYGSREKYLNETAGINSRLDPVQAAILNVKLDRLDEWNERRGNLAAIYTSALSGLNDVTPVTGSDEGVSVWHVYGVEVPDRQALVAHLNQAGIGTLIHYPVPPHLSVAYEGAGFTRGAFPITERKADCELSLPMGPQLTPNQVETVISALSTFSQGSA